MSSVNQAVVRPVVLDGPCGRLSAVHIAPAGKSMLTPSATIYVPPFAEELNRSRRMASLQARAFASKGISTLLLDPFGTGESDGDFGDARLSTWLGDISVAATWLERAGHARLVLWGLRSGALLACAVAATEPERFKRLLLWQPIIDGKSLLTQFLRIRVAGSMSGTRETTKDLREQLMSGRSVEVAGYEISAALANALDETQMGALRLAPGTRVDWLGVTPEPGSRLAPLEQRVIDRWREGGTTVSITMVPGDPFWATQEITMVPELIAASTTRLADALV